MTAQPVAAESDLTRISGSDDYIGQTWFPYLVSILRDTLGNYLSAMGAVLAVALVGAISILMLPRKSKLDETLRGREPVRASVK